MPGTALALPIDLERAGYEFLQSVGMNIAFREDSDVAEIAATPLE